MYSRNRPSGRDDRRGLLAQILRDCELTRADIQREAADRRRFILCC
jgi:hypothetical protein